jgi:hypothetical protein
MRFFQNGSKNIKNFIEYIFYFIFIARVLFSKNKKYYNYKYKKIIKCLMKMHL